MQEGPVSFNVLPSIGWVPEWSIGHAWRACVPQGTEGSNPSPSAILVSAFRLLLVRVAAEKALPFEPLNPNAETVEAMKAARRGELVKVGKPDKLLRKLNAGC